MKEDIEIGATYWDYTDDDSYVSVTEVISAVGCANHSPSGQTDTFENRHLLSTGQPSGLFINRHRWIKIHEPNGEPVDIDGVAVQIEEQQPMYNYRVKSWKRFF